MGKKTEFCANFWLELSLKEGFWVNFRGQTRGLALQTAQCDLEQFIFSLLEKEHD